MVLTNGKGNVHATDEEGNTIIEAADGLGMVLDSNSNIIAVGYAERNVVLIDRESISLLPMRRATPSSKPQTVQARC